MEGGVASLTLDFLLSCLAEVTSFNIWWEMFCVNGSFTDLFRIDVYDFVSIYRIFSKIH